MKLKQWWKIKQRWMLEQSKEGKNCKKKSGMKTL